jgi:hypothetical protein
MIRRLARSAPGLLRVGALGVAAALLFGCGGGEPKTADDARPPNEPPEVGVIVRAIRAAGMKPAPGREVKLTTGGSIFVDVRVEGHEFGIAYIDQNDLKWFGGSIPPYGNDPQQRLRIVRGGADGETRILLLYYQAYDYRARPGRDRTLDVTTLGVGLAPQLGVGLTQLAVESDLDDKRKAESERKLTLDAQKFIDYARAKNFK